MAMEPSTLLRASLSLIEVEVVGVSSHFVMRRRALMEGGRLWYVRWQASWWRGGLPGVPFFLILGLEATFFQSGLVGGVGLEAGARRADWG